MSKEINFFDQEIETITQPKSAAAQTPSPQLDKFVLAQPADMATQTRLHVKRVIEAMLFASNEPLPFQKIKEVTDTIHEFPPRVIKGLLENLQDEYVNQQRAFRLEEIAQGYVLRTREEYSLYIEQLGRNKRSEKLSHASAEVLAIIAYKQPITRPQIDAIRGVDSSGTIVNLIERQLIEPVGKLEAPGRPTLYGITKDFLKHFGLKDLNELPKVD